MRQWELIGITDTAEWTPPRREPEPSISRLPAVLWTTDGSLRLRNVSKLASDHLGIHARFLEGRELLDAFGMEGESLPVLEGHAAALTGEVVTFTLPGTEGRLRCRVAPTHDAGEHVVGTFCIAVGPSTDGDEPIAAKDAVLSIV
ncbi:MAG TPA: hypothetical protein VF108_10630 [Actinomycetota bacterium]